MTNLLFGFKGRVKRRSFFFCTAGALAAYSLLIFFFPGVRFARTTLMPVPAGFILSAVFAWVWLALFVKRGRDAGIFWVWSVLLTLFLSPFTWLLYLLLRSRK